MTKALKSDVVPITSVNQEASNVESEKPQSLSIVKEFALTTSIHGLPNIARSPGKCNCIFWFISFLIFAAVMSYCVIDSIQTYFQYPTQTSVSISMERSQVFPAVTFCNYAPGRYDTTIGPFLNYTNSLNLTNTNDTSTFTLEQYSYFRDFFIRLLSSGNPVNDYLYTIDMTLMNCSYNGQTCTANDFISFHSSQHGLCYTFNARPDATNGTKLRFTDDNGGPGKLSLRLYSHSHLYIPYLSEGLFHQ